MIFVLTEQNGTINETENVAKNRVSVVEYSRAVGTQICDDLKARQTEVDKVIYIELGVL